MIVEDKPPLDEALLKHFGVKGMHWGVRKDAAPGVHPRVDKMARKDAQEHARAKMFYGKGAGTRRKLINAKVESNSKKHAGYKKAFDHHLARQDMGQHASKAKSERTRKNTTETGKKTTMAILRRTTNQAGNVAAITVAVGTVGAAFLMTPQGQRVFEAAVRTLR
jgi:hypothetical protein